MSDDTKHVSSTEVPPPDWYFATDDELQAHAVAVTDDNLQQLASLAEDSTRPPGTAPHTVVTLPGHLGGNITKQVQYLGYIAERALEHGLTIRGIDSHYDADTKTSSVLAVLARAVDIEIAQAEEEASTRH